MEDRARRRGLRSMPDARAAELPMSSFSARYRAPYEFYGRGGGENGGRSGMSEVLRWCDVEWRESGEALGDDNIL